MQATCGEKVATNISTFVSIFVFVYLMYSGIYQDWWEGASVGLYCKVICIWALLQMTCFGLFACFLCVFVGAAHIVKNQVIKQMQEQYEEKMKDISGPRRDYYESQFFRNKMDSLFDQADSDGNGSLDMKELESVLVEVTGEPDITQMAPLLQQAFKDHGNSAVEKHEFVEMMKFVSVCALQEGKFTAKQAFEILQLPETASKAEVSKSYRKMAMKYHPDKRKDVDDETAKRDMGQINDAHAKVQEFLKEKDTEASESPTK